MAIVVQSTVNIANEPAPIWRLLIEPPTWQTWWPDCLDAQAANLRPLREGSELEVTVQPRMQKMTFNPVVDLCIEHKVLSLTHRSGLVQCTVSWRLEPSEEGTRVTARGVFKGLAALTMRLFRQDDTARFSLHSNVRGLKKVAERMV